MSKAEVPCYKPVTEHTVLIHTDTLEEVLLTVDDTELGPYSKLINTCIEKIYK